MFKFTVIMLSFGFMTTAFKLTPKFTKLAPLYSSVSSIIDLVASSNRGLDATPSTRLQLSTFIADKSKEYTCKANALNDPLIVGDYEVSYVSEGLGRDGGKQSSGNSAGGLFRGNIGKFLFRTDGLYQNILRNDNGELIAINFVKGCFF